MVAINAASMSTKLSGLPFSGPIGATRVAHVDGQWVAFPTLRGARAGPPSTWSSPAASLPDGDVAIMMVEAEATAHTVDADRRPARTAPTEEVVASGLEAAKPAIRELCRAQSELAAVAAKPVAEFPVFLDYQDDVYDAVAGAVRDEVARGAAASPASTSARRPSTGSRPRPLRAARRRSSRAARRRSAPRSGR